ncbi:MAG: asparagine synthase-related protein [Candidatus Anstonellales archaeon]
MPGICSVISKNEIDKDLFALMVNSLKHEDFHIVDQYYSQNFACARIHLGIFNPMKQPVFNKDKSICVMMDGKIYGYYGNNDLEYILKSYETHDLEFIKELNGNFVILIYDFERKMAIIANDRFAFRTHYYAFHNEKLYLAPEIKAFFLDKTFKKELDNEGLVGFLAFGDIIGGRSFFKGIRIIEPASIIKFDGKKMSVEKYWEFSYHPDYSKREEEFVEELIKAFKHAVRIRVKDDLRYSVSLSGGLDSRIVLSILSAIKKEKINAVTWGSEDCDEVKIARRVAKKLGISSHLIIDITPDLILKFAEKEVFLSDGHSYIGEGYAYPVMKEVKKITDVLLDGSALDLTLGGSYLTHRAVNFNGTDEEFMCFLLKSKPYSRFFYSSGELKQLFSPEYYERIKHIPLKLFREQYKKLKSKEYGNKCDEFAMNVHVAYTQVGDITVRNFVEVTHPTGDNDFIDIILSIPPEKRMSHKIYRKFLMRIAPSLAKIPYEKTMAPPILPTPIWKILLKYNSGKTLIKNRIIKYINSEILKDKKSYVSFSQWFQTNKQWQEFFKKIFIEDPPKNSFFNKSYIKTMLEEQIKGRRNNAIKLLYLATIYMLIKEYFG